MHREGEAKVQEHPHTSPHIVDEDYLQSIMAGPWQEWIMDPGWIRIPKYHMDKETDTEASDETGSAGKETLSKKVNAAVMMMKTPHIENTVVRATDINTEKVTQFDESSLLSMFKSQRPIVKACYKMLFSGSLKFHNPDELREYFLSEVKHGALSSDWLHNSNEFPDFEKLDHDDDMFENVPPKLDPSDEF